MPYATLPECSDEMYADAHAFEPARLSVVLEEQDTDISASLSEMVRAEVLELREALAFERNERLQQHRTLTDRVQSEGKATFARHIELMKAVNATQAQVLRDSEGSCQQIKECNDRLQSISPDAVDASLADMHLRITAVQEHLDKSVGQCVDTIGDLELKFGRLCEDLAANAEQMRGDVDRLCIDRDLLRSKLSDGLDSSKASVEEQSMALRRLALKVADQGDALRDIRVTLKDPPSLQDLAREAGGGVEIRTFQGSCDETSSAGSILAASMATGIGRSISARSPPSPVKAPSTAPFQANQSGSLSPSKRALGIAPSSARNQAPPLASCYSALMLGNDAYTPPPPFSSFQQQLTTGSLSAPITPQGHSGSTQRPRSVSPVPYFRAAANPTRSMPPLAIAACSSRRSLGSVF